MGFEPMNTGFADQRVSHFAIGAYRGKLVGQACHRLLHRAAHRSTSCPMHSLILLAAQRQDLPRLCCGADIWLYFFEAAGIKLVRLFV